MLDVAGGKNNTVLYSNENDSERAELAPGFAEHDVFDWMRKK